MNEFPKKKEEQIINRYMAGEILFTGLYSASLCVLFLKAPFIKSFFRMDNNNVYLMTAFFGLFIFMTIFNSFNARTNRLNLLANILKNRVFLIIILFILIVQVVLIYYGGDLFRTAGLTYTEFLIVKNHADFALLHLHKNTDDLLTDFWRKFAVFLAHIFTKRRFHSICVNQLDFPFAAFFLPVG